MERDLDLILDGKVAPKTTGPVAKIKARDVLEVANQYYVLASSLGVENETRVLKQGETFAVFDNHGDVRPVTHPEAGLFHRGTRYLSRLELNFPGDERPLLLNSLLRDDNGLLKVDMTNRDLVLPDAGFLPKGSLHIHREKFLAAERCFERIEITSFTPREIHTDLSLFFAGDFADIFEVRGIQRKTRGRLSAPRIDHDSIEIDYTGLDHISRSLRLTIRGASFTFDDDRLRIAVELAPRARKRIDLEFEFIEEGERAPALSFEEGLEQIWSDHSAGRRKFSSLRSSNEQFDEWWQRSTDDLVMMTTLTPEGELYPYAGIPWFCAAFGRDGILTALECLWANPELARGTLKFLAKTQAKEIDPERDATPGKIIHEVRYGEMASLKEIPFGRYYGSIDATPLFVALAGQYFTRTNDLETVRALWPELELALRWMDEFGDLDGDGFIEYRRENPKGLVQQGWKDSTDSIFHADGQEARGPIALAEVQAYAFMARVEGAKIAEALGRHDRARELRETASSLQTKFDESFWLEELGTFALALDGAKKPCRVATSNAGQCLFTGIVKQERLPKLVATLMSPESFSGWGVRTVATTGARFNPMSYHNGSVWPHDVALVAWGLAKCGYMNEVERIFNGLFKAAKYMDLMRMPEVFCGFARREGEAPTLYPHACAPQAWSAAAVYMMVQALLGLEIDATQNQIRLRRPRLPLAIESIKISDLRVGENNIDLVAQNYFSDVGVQIASRSGDLTLIVVK